MGYRNSGHEVRLLGVDPAPENLRAFGEKFKLSPDQLFSSTAELYEAITPDCVSICTWPALHHSMVLEALENGVKSIACEKPFTIDVGEQRELERRVKNCGATLVIAHQRRLEASFKTLKDVALSGRLGSKLHLQGHVGDDWDILAWTTHWFDMANFFFDGPPQWLLAGMDLARTRRYGQAVENASIIYAHYSDSREATFLTGPGAGTSFLVQGDEGLARIGAGAVEVATFQESFRVPFDPSEPGGFAELLGQMLTALDGGPDPMCSIAHSAVATEMAYAAHESARTGKKVSLPFDTQFAPLELLHRSTCSVLAGKRLLLYADAHFGSGRTGRYLGCFCGSDGRTRTYRGR